jgi:ketosteroid isomerase-like protein
MANVESVNRIMDAFNQAFNSGDPAAAERCFADGAIVWHNIDGIELTVQGMIGGMKTFVHLMPIRRVEVQQRYVLEDICVQQHAIVGHNSRGQAVRLLSCIVCRFAADGKIERIDEYLDSAALSQLVAKA